MINSPLTSIDTASILPCSASKKSSQDFGKVMPLLEFPKDMIFLMMGNSFDFLVRNNRKVFIKRFLSYSND